MKVVHVEQRHIIKRYPRTEEADLSFVNSRTQIMRQRSQTLASPIHPRGIVTTRQDPNQTTYHRSVNVAKPFALIPLPLSQHTHPQVVKAPTATDTHTAEFPPSAPAAASPRLPIPTRQPPHAPARHHRPSHHIPTIPSQIHENTVVLQSTDGSRTSGARSSAKKGD